MAGNKVYVQGSYVDIHDNEVVNLSIDKAGAVKVDKVDKVDKADKTDKEQGCASVSEQGCEELFKFVHPSVHGDGERLIHDEVKHLVARHDIQEICGYLKQMADERRILLPQSPASAYAELVRMGMPHGEGFSEKTFQKHYRR